MDSGMTLSDVLARDASLHWCEGVALVRGVADRLLEGSGERPAIPDLQQIVLSNRGTIDLTGGAACHDPVARLGQLLQALLAQAEAPVQLRLVISQATAPEPAYRSIREYADALAYFERPDRQAVLQALYARADAAPAASGPAKPRTVDALAPPRPVEPKKARRRRFSKRGVRIAVAASLIVVLGVAATLYVRVSALTVPNQPALSTAASHAKDVVGRAAFSGLSAVTERLGLGRLISPETRSVSPLTVEPAHPPTPAGRWHRPARPKSGPHAVIAFDLEPDAPPVATTGSAAEERDKAIQAAADDLPPVNPDQTVYSPRSEGVVPPVAVRPRLPRELPSAIGREKLARFEVVVGTDGLVESVKLVDPPRDVQDAMFLSVAKAWAFQPALKDGEAVRYRKTIWVLTQ